jgi:hypothetical protein
MNITKTFIGAACLFLSTAAISSEEPPLEEGDVVTQDPILIPLRMSISGNPVIKIRNRANQVLFLEVLSDGETGGEALYEDDRGKILEVKWDDQRIIYFDSHPCHHFKNIIVPEHYQVEEIKSLGEMIGSTSTIISRNGHGGIVRARGGSLAEQLLELQDLSERVLSHLPDNTEQEIKNLRESFFTGL